MRCWSCVHRCLVRYSHFRVPFPCGHEFARVDSLLALPFGHILQRISVSFRLRLFNLKICIALSLPHCPFNWLHVAPSLLLTPKDVFSLPHEQCNFSFSLLSV